jgi:hypothetical protein
MDDNTWWFNALIERQLDHQKWIEWRLKSDWGIYKIRDSIKALEDKWAWMSQHPVQNKKLQLKRKNEVKDDAPVLSEDDAGAPPSTPAVDVADPIEEVQPFTYHIFMVW